MDDAVMGLLCNVTSSSSAIAASVQGCAEADGRSIGRARQMWTSQ